MAKSGRGMASTDGQLPRALTTLPTMDSGTFGHSRGRSGRVARQLPRERGIGRRGSRWYQTPRPAITRGSSRTRRDACRMNQRRTDNGVQRHRHRRPPDPRRLPRRRGVRRTRPDPGVPVARRRQRRQARGDRAQGGIPCRRRQAPPGPCARRRSGGQRARRRMRAEKRDDPDAGTTRSPAPAAQAIAATGARSAAWSLRRRRSRRTGSRMEVAGRGRMPERGGLPLRRHARRGR